MVTITLLEQWALKKLDKYFKRHNLYKLDWSYEIDNCKNRGGVCKYASKTISISRNYINAKTTDKKDIRNTILHEIAHALTPKQRHNNIWRRKAIEIGCNGKRCLKVDFNEEKDFKWLMKCEKGCVIKRHKLMKRWRLPDAIQCGKHKLYLKIIQQ